MKSILSMSAISAIQHDTELKKYYEKRVNEGKTKMVVLDIIRNKLVSRFFTTINRGTPYVDLSSSAAQKEIIKLVFDLGMQLAEGGACEALTCLTTTIVY